MINQNYFKLTAFTIIVFWLVSCSPKIVQQSSEKGYSEDLSSVLPPVDSIEQETVTMKEKLPYEAPSHDITNEMDNLLDSLSKDALHRKITVYAIQVYIGNNREEANDARMKVYGVLENEIPRLEYTQPNFRVKVGKYNSRLEANKSFTILKKSFPGALLVPERAYLKP